MNTIFDVEDKLVTEIETKKLKIKNDRYSHFEEWLKNNDFDELMYRLILEHNEDYRRKCYDNGCEPYPNNKLAFIIDYIVDHFETINHPEIHKDFPNDIWEFNGYYFQMVYGQGVVTFIYNKEDLRQLLVL
jgi:hypothetical protein